MNRKESILKRIKEAKGKDFEVEAIKFDSVEEALYHTSPEIFESYKKLKRELDK